MKKFLVILCVGFLCPYLWAEKREKKGEITISYIEGEVEVLPSGKKDWEKAELYQKLTMGDRIRTKFSSKAELKLTDGSTINMSENSIMDITELLEKGLTTKSGFKLWMGGIKARFERLKTKDSEAKFYTPTAVMAIRGTTAWLLVDWEGRTRCGFEKGSGYIYSDKEGEKPVNENEEASVSLEGDITIKTLKMKTVPNVIGKMLDDAKNDIIAAGLKLGEIRAEESDQPKDTVLSQYPAATSEVLANTSVNLVVASEIPPCIVPYLIGMQRADAEKAIKEAGLVLGMVIEQISTKPKDEVLKQRPNPGTEVKKESLVDLLISSGPPPKVIVPDLIGRSIEEARGMLEEVGLRLSGIILKKESAIIAEGKIAEQKPSAGEEVGEGSFVQVWTAQPPVAEKPPLPNIHHQFSIPGLFVQEIPYLILHITPADKKLAPLFLQVMGRLTRFDNPPYLLNFKPPVMNIGVNKINVSAWFENGDKRDEVIETPYYDPLPPKIVSVRVIKGSVKIGVVVEDKESGIKNVKIDGEIIPVTEGIQEERKGITVWTRGTYEKVITVAKDAPAIIPIRIEVEDNAGNKRQRTERIPEPAFSLPSHPTK
ncbi:MAG: PASTA domain-containing protein [bacterium]